MFIPRMFALAISLYLARLYGAYVGYHVYSIGGPAGEYFYGGGTVFIVALLVSGLIIDRILWPMFLGSSQLFISGASFGMLSLTRKVHERPPMTSDEIKEAVEQGYLLQYHGLVSRRMRHHGGERKYSWLRSSIAIERNTLAMPMRERFFVRVLLELQNHGLPKDASNRLTFALAWGDGRARVSGSKIKGDPVVLAQHQIRDHRSLVAFEAGQEDVTVEGAITELATILQRAAQHPNAPEEITALKNRLLQLRDRL